MVIGRSRNAEQQEKWKQSAKYWKALPLRSTVLFLLAVFCTFASIGTLGSIFNMRESGVASAIAWGALSGGFAVFYALSGTRRYIKLMCGTAVAQFTVNALLPTFLEKHFPPAAKFALDARLQRTVMTEAALTMIFVLLSYIFFISFAGGEGRRVYGAFTELRLANEIHRSLVPPIRKSIGGFEIAAFSAPSGEMGGDLVDVAEGRGGWMAYLADVSGHGVAAGMVMSMVKSAVRMHVQENVSIDLPRMLASLNSVLTPLSSASTFVTLACIACNQDGRIAYSLAGHLPILHYRSATGGVEERAIVNFPLGIFDDSRFDTAQTECRPGDLLALLTDGLTEAANGDGTELGLEPLKRELAESSQRPLDEVLHALRQRSLQFGKQVDDQSVLVLRCC